MVVHLFLLSSLLLSTTALAASSRSSCQSQAPQSASAIPSSRSISASVRPSSSARTISTAKPSQAAASSATASSASRSSSSRSGSAVSSRGTGSSRISSSATSSNGNSTISISGCPPVTLTTKTLNLTSASVTVTETIPARTSTIYASTISTTTTGTISFERTVPESYFTSFVGTVTVYDLSVVPALTTVIVPTPSGFTPLKCQAEYYNPTTAVTSLDGTFTDAYYEPSVTITVSDYTTDLRFEISSDVTTITTTAFTVYREATVTSSVTRSEATRTVYAACATNNVTPNYPGGRAPYIGQVGDPYPPGTPVTTPVVVPAIDAVDCCAACQANPSCTASAFGAQNIFPGDNKPNICTLFLRNGTQACDPTFIGAQIQYSTTKPLYNVSNGACGHYNVLWIGQFLL